MEIEHDDQRRKKKKKGPSPKVYLETQNQTLIGSRPTRIKKVYQALRSGNLRSLEIAIVKSTI